MKAILGKTGFAVSMKHQNNRPESRLIRSTGVMLVGFVLVFLLSSCQTKSSSKEESFQFTPAAASTATSSSVPISTQEPTLPTVASTSLPTVDFDPAYTESTPLKDTQKMLSILESLQQMEFRGLSEPGWYLRYDLMEPKLFPDDENINSLVHVVDQKGSCQEQMVFFRKNGKISPFLFMSSDGSRGSVDQATGEVYKMDDLNIPPAICDLQNPGSLAGMGTDYYILSNFLGDYRRTMELIDQQSQYGTGEFNAWFEHENEKDVFVVQYRSIGATGGVAMDDETQQFQTISSLVRWEVYDLSSGRPIRSGEENYLSNGKTTRRESELILEYYPELPADMQAAFDQAVTGLEEVKK